MLLKGRQNKPFEFQNLSFDNRLRSISIEKQFYTSDSPAKRSRNKSIDYISQRKKDLSEKKEKKDNKDVSLVTYLTCQNSRLLNYLELKNQENKELISNLEAISQEINSLTEEGQFILSEDAKLVISQNESLRQMLNEKAHLIAQLEKEVEKKEAELCFDENIEQKIEEAKERVSKSKETLSKSNENLQLLYKQLTDLSNKQRMQSNQMTISLLSTAIQQATSKLETLNLMKAKLKNEADKLKERAGILPKAKTLSDYLADSAEMRSNIIEMKNLLQVMDDHIESHKKEEILSSIANLNRERLQATIKNIF